ILPADCVSLFAHHFKRAGDLRLRLRISRHNLYLKGVLEGQPHYPRPPGGDAPAKIRAHKIRNRRDEICPIGQVENIDAKVNSMGIAQREHLLRGEIYREAFASLIVRSSNFGPGDHGLMRVQHRAAYGASSVWLGRQLLRGDDWRGCGNNKAEADSE